LYNASDKGEEFTVFYVKYLTLLMCFDIGDYSYNHMSVVKSRCGKTLRILWLKHHIFGFPHNAQHFHLCPRTLLPTVSLSNPCHCILSANSLTEQDVLQFPKSIFHKHTPLWTS